MILDPSKFPPWVHMVVQVFFALWLLATVTSQALRTIPEERYKALDASFPAFGHFARACRKFGMDVWPFLQEFVKAVAIGIFRRPGGGGAAVVLFAVALAGCPLPPPDNCTPFETRCSAEGVPQTCSSSQRWEVAPPASPCAQRGPAIVCCRRLSPWGRELSSCGAPSSCLGSDGGAP